MKIGDIVIYQNKICTIWEINNNKCNLLLPERNVETSSLLNFCDRNYVKGDFVLYTKNNIQEIVFIVSLDLYYNYAQIRILKTKCDIKDIEIFNK